MTTNVATDTRSSSGAACTIRPAAYLMATGSGLGPAPDVVQLPGESGGSEAVDTRAVRIQRLGPVEEDHGHVVSEDLLDLVVDLSAPSEVRYLPAPDDQLIDDRV